MNLISTEEEEEESGSCFPPRALPCYYNTADWLCPSGGSRGRKKTNKAVIWCVNNAVYLIRSLVEQGLSNYCFFNLLRLVKEKEPCIGKCLCVNMYFNISFAIASIYYIHYLSIMICYVKQHYTCRQLNYLNDKRGRHAANQLTWVRLIHVASAGHFRFFTKI